MEKDEQVRKPEPGMNSEDAKGMCSDHPISTVAIAAATTTTASGSSVEVKDLIRDSIIEGGQDGDEDSPDRVLAFSRSVNKIDSSLE
ncbi:hypothetical protein MLD38_015270 [Melastoma candidum]|uniref:Uncharacterized protein n=1 Tax=Melastoma candidum TaxID=119954 RepID=A0ACB9RFF4_9MYRT|nr:hypothetical protein MLD38_015270 [Melastoma candidum]